MAAIAFAAVYFGLSDTADKIAEDILYHHTGGASEKIKIIKIDDRSIDALGDYEKWDRDIYADLIDTLCVSETVRPAVIGFDILFDSSNNDEADNRFAKVCKQYGNTVCAFSYVFDRKLQTDENGNPAVNNIYVTDVILPYSELYNAARHGFANALMDNDDGYIRRSFLYFTEEGNHIEYSLNAEIYRAYTDVSGLPCVLPDGMSYGFRYSGHVGEYENVSLSDVLDGTVPAEAFDGCIVLVGAYAAGMMDSYYVPVDHSRQMYGVEIHANAIQALIEQKYLYDIPLWLSAIGNALLAWILSYICGGASVGKVIGFSAGIPAAKLIAGYAVFNVLGYSGNILVFPIVSAITAAYYIAAHYYAANHAKKKIENAFKKYVAPEIVTDIAKNGSYELSLGGETRDIAVLFVDIRGFTPLSENLAPARVVDVLNEYLEVVTKCIFKHGGTLDKFIGDAAMAIFNAPFDTEDYIHKAVLTAWDIVRYGVELDRRLYENYGIHISFGVGVNCGPAVVGNIGCSFRMDYTAIGDTVNTAARLEEKAPGGTVYISKDVYERVKDRITAEPVGELSLKGKSKSVFVYSVTGVPDCNVDRLISDVSRNH